MLKWFADKLAETGKEARKDERGFTLIELLVVVIIIGILAAIAIPTFLNQRENAQQSTLETDARNAASQIQSWGTEQNGDYSDVATTNAFDADGDYEVQWSEVGGEPNGFTDGPEANNDDDGFRFTVRDEADDLDQVFYNSEAGGIVDQDDYNQGFGEA